MSHIRISGPSGTATDPAQVQHAPMLPAQFSSANAEQAVVAPSIPLARQSLATLNTAYAPADLFLLRAGRLFSSAAGVDSFLCALRYATMMMTTQFKFGADISSALSARSSLTSPDTGIDYTPATTSVAPRPGASSRAGYLPSLPVGVSEKLSDLATIPKEHSLHHAAALSDKISALCSDHRAFVRLWGLFGTYAWLRRNMKSSTQDRTTRAIIWTQIMVQIVLTGIENWVYLVTSGVIRGQPKTKAKVGKWRSVLWGAFLLLDLGRLMRVWRSESERLQQIKRRVGKEKRSALEPHIDHEQWWRQLIINLAYLPIAYNSCFDHARFGDGWTGALGCTASFLNLGDQWKRVKT